MLGNNKRTSQQDISRAVAHIAVAELPEQLALAFALDEEDRGSAIVIDPRMEIFEEPLVPIDPPPVEEKPEKLLSRKAARRAKAIATRRAALRAKSRIQRRPCGNGGRQRSAQNRGRR
jgi:hypothetical protein